jgi:Family of unknown function (DUF6338)
VELVPNTGTAVIIVVSFLLPGFVTVLLQERTFRSADDPTSLDRLLRIVWLSAWSYLLVALVALALGVDKASITRFYDHHRGDPALLIGVGALLVLVPSLVIEGASRWWSRSATRVRFLSWYKVNERHTEPTAWDFFMRQRRDCYVRVTFTDGTRVLGYYGAASFAAYSKDGRDLYLERVFAPTNNDDQWFGEEITGNCGVWIKTADAVAVEFYTPDYDSSEEIQPGPATRLAVIAAALWLGREAWRARRAARASNRAQAAACPQAIEEQLSNDER